MNDLKDRRVEEVKDAIWSYVAGAAVSGFLFQACDFIVIRLPMGIGLHLLQLAIPISIVLGVCILSFITIGEDEKGLIFSFIKGFVLGSICFWAQNERFFIGIQPAIAAIFLISYGAGIVFCTYLTIKEKQTSDSFRRFSFMALFLGFIFDLILLIAITLHDVQSTLLQRVGLLFSACILFFGIQGMRSIPLNLPFISKRQIDAEIEAKREGDDPLS